jgi:hypothetical protein
MASDKNGNKEIIEQQQPKTGKLYVMAMITDEKVVDQFRAAGWDRTELPHMTLLELTVNIDNMDIDTLNRLTERIRTAYNTYMADMLMLRQGITKYQNLNNTKTHEAIKYSLQDGNNQQYRNFLLRALDATGELLATGELEYKDKQGKWLLKKAKHYTADVWEPHITFRVSQDGQKQLELNAAPDKLHLGTSAVLQVSLSVHDSLKENENVKTLKSLDDNGNEPFPSRYVGKHTFVMVFGRRFYNDTAELMVQKVPEYKSQDWISLKKMSGNTILNREVIQDMQVLYQQAIAQEKTTVKIDNIGLLQELIENHFKKIHNIIDILNTK